MISAFKVDNIDLKEIAGTIVKNRYAKVRRLNNLQANYFSK